VIAVLPKPVTRLRQCVNAKHDGTRNKSGDYVGGTDSDGTTAKGSPNKGLTCALSTLLHSSADRS
jgi:hypothetical protein